MCVLLQRCQKDIRMGVERQQKLSRSGCTTPNNNNDRRYMEFATRYINIYITFKRLHNVQTYIERTSFDHNNNNCNFVGTKEQRTTQRRNHYYYYCLVSIHIFFVSLFFGKSNTHDTVTTPQQGQDVVLLDRVQADRELAISSLPCPYFQQTPPQLPVAIASSAIRIYLAAASIGVTSALPARYIIYCFFGYSIIEFFKWDIRAQERRSPYSANYSYITVKLACPQFFHILNSSFANTF